MKLPSVPLFSLVRVATLAACLTAVAAHADDYADVSRLVHAGNLSAAQAIVQRHLAKAPRDAQMRLYKGIIQRESGRPNDALVTFLRMTEDFPDLPEPYNNLAVIYASLGQYNKARDALEKALHTNPSYAAAYDNLGSVYSVLASQAYSKALQVEASASPLKLAMISDLHPIAGPQTPVIVAAVPPRAPSPPPPATKASTVAAAAPAPKPAPLPPPPAAKPVTATAAKPAPAAVPPPAAPAAKPPAPPAVAAAPVHPVAAPVPVPAGDAREAVEKAIADWAKAWSDRDMTRYLAAYAKDFDPPGQMPRSAWEEQRRNRIVGKKRISVAVGDLHVTVKDGRAVAKFRQDYKADTLAVVSLKTLELARTGDRWLIVREASGN